MEGMLKVLVFCIIVGMIFAMVFGGYEELTKTELEDCQFEAVVEFKYAEDGKYDLLVVDSNDTTIELRVNTDEFIEYQNGDTVTVLRKGARYKLMGDKFTYEIIGREN